KLEDLGKFKVINISIDAVIPDPGALSEVLYSIETRTPYLIVKELDIRIRNYRDPRELMLKLDVSALYGGK
ncbi:MAG: type II secretion system protein M, partial [Nitrospirota bacterium]|nr:type II secretion system protein M [Nitrospirota bacterium]